MWVLPDVVGLFSINLGPFSRNVGQRGRIFSANLVPNRPMLSGRAIYVLGPLQVRVNEEAPVSLASRSIPRIGALVWVTRLC